MSIEYYLEIDGVPACEAEGKGWIDLELCELSCSYFNLGSAIEAAEKAGCLGFNAKVKEGMCPHAEEV